MIEYMALKMAEGIKRRAPNHPASVNVLKFTLAVVINTAGIILFTILISFATDRTIEALLILVGFAALRMLTGGIHLKTGSMCVLVTTALFTVISLIQVNFTLQIILNILSIVIIFALAPAGIEKQSKIPKKYYRHLKIGGIVLVVLNFLIGSDILAICYFVQALTLLPFIPKTFSRKGVKTRG